MRLHSLIEKLKVNLRYVFNFYQEELTIVTVWWAWNIPFQFISIFISLLIYYYYGLTVGGSSPILGKIIVFIIVGLMVNTLLDISMDAYYSAIAALYRGRVGVGGLAISRVDYLYLAGISPSVFIFARVSYAYLTQTIVSFLYFFIGQFFGLTLPPPENISLIIVVLILGIIACSGIGLISASMYWLVGSYRGIEPIRWSIRTLVSLVSGVYIPLDVLPRELRAISIILPQTYALKGIRVALIPGVTLSQILPYLKALVIFSIILVPVGLVMLKYSLNLERKRGAIY